MSTTTTPNNKETVVKQQQQQQHEHEHDDEKHYAAHEIAKVFPPVGVERARMTLPDYHSEYAASIADPSAYWAAQATKRLDWYTPFPQSLQGNLTNGDVTWFAGGKLNVCYNCIDRHVLNGKGHEIAMIWEGDEPTEIRRLSFIELQQTVSQIAHALASVGVQRGDVVTIYMPMMVELPATMLACARLGAVHSVVFAGFSAEAVAQRVSAASSRYIVTADYGLRGGKTVPLLEIVQQARLKYNVEDLLQSVLVWERKYDASAATAAASTSSEPPAPKFDMTIPKLVRMNILVANQRPYFPPAVMDAEDALFILYTSGSTGQPKGLLHTTGGYALYAAHTAQMTFGLKLPAPKNPKNNDDTANSSGKSTTTTNQNPDDDDDNVVFACVADCGWITGHSYVLYGPLLNGVTTFVFESTPVYPTPSRYWDMIQTHKITHFYTAPTAIRLLMRYGDGPVLGKDTSSVKVLGTVGEPINPEAWRWYYEVVGKGNCTVVDTYWQTETGGHLITNLPGVTPMKPGSCTLPCMGIDPVVLDPLTGHVVTTPDEKGHYTGVLGIQQPWPGIARTLIGAHERYLQTYLHVYKGYYFTGDSVVRDQDGYYWIIGRVDDVLNVSGHRIGTAEVESALVSHAAVAQAAVVGQPHDIKGQSIAAFCMLVEGYEESATLTHELRALVRQDIGGFASPDLIICASSLPMTRSGKIMRRILRKIVCHEVDSLGDTSTLADPSIVDVLIQKVAEMCPPPQH